MSKTRPHQQGLCFLVCELGLFFPTIRLSHTLIMMFLVQVLLCLPPCNSQTRSASWVTGNWISFPSLVCKLHDAKILSVFAPQHLAQHLAHCKHYNVSCNYIVSITYKSTVWVNECMNKHGPFSQRAITPLKAMMAFHAPSAQHKVCYEHLVNDYWNEWNFHVQATTIKYYGK